MRASAQSGAEEKTASGIMEFHGVRYLVSDVQRAVDFYRHHLGFSVEHQHLPEFATISFDSLKILLSGPRASGSRPVAGRPQSSGGFNRVVLAVSGLAELAESLRESGVTLRNEIETGPAGSQIQIEDPDGNPIELFEPAHHR